MQMGVPKRSSVTYLPRASILFLLVFQAIQNVPDEENWSYDDTSVGHRRERIHRASSH